MKANRSVIIIYEDGTTRREAVAFCDQLTQRFAQRCAFDTLWWSFANLDQVLQAEEAASKAAQADWIIFTAKPTGQMPATVTNWVEVWLDRRHDREGVLVGLIPPGPLAEEAASKHTYLRHVAHRGGMDYLTQLPGDLDQAMPDSPDYYTQRAGEVTSVLDAILHQPLLPAVPRSDQADS